MHSCKYGHLTSFQESLLTPSEETGEYDISISVYVEVHVCEIR